MHTLFRNAMDSNKWNVGYMAAGLLVRLFEGLELVDAICLVNLLNGGDGGTTDLKMAEMLNSKAV